MPRHSQRADSGTLEATARFEDHQGWLKLHQAFDQGGDAQFRIRHLPTLTTWASSHVQVILGNVNSNEHVGHQLVLRERTSLGPVLQIRAEVARATVRAAREQGETTELRHGLEWDQSPAAYPAPVPRMVCEDTPQQYKRLRTTSSGTSCPPSWTRRATRASA